MMMNAAAMRKITEKARLDLGTQTIDHWIEDVAIPEMKERAELGFSNCEVTHFPPFLTMEISKRLCQYAGQILNKNGYDYSTNKEKTEIIFIYW